MQLNYSFTEIRHSVKVILAAMAALLLFAHTARAHKVTVFAWVEGNTIHTESKFSGGRLVKKGKIEVLNSHGKLLLEAITDNQGRFSFPIPEKTDLKVVLTAGAGHGNHWIVKAQELGGTPVDPAPETKPKVPATPRSSDTLTVQGPCLDAGQVERIIELNLDRKLAPLKAQLAEQSWGLRDIVSGFGYILGLMGLAAYLHFRKSAKARM
ncbi:MAG: hypothetical protein GY874_19965 [Desulfobacteraceae bacterium]|nr:hypothetical protein [Desulfobacteraceae bacterium]